MSLFENSSQEKLDLKTWLKEIHIELNGIATCKSKAYNFNFFKGLPSRFQPSYLESGLSIKYDWTCLDSKNNNDKGEFSARPSRNPYLDDHDFLDDLLDLQ